MAYAAVSHPLNTPAMRTRFSTLLLLAAILCHVACDQAPLPTPTLKADDNEPNRLLPERLRRLPDVIRS